MAVRSDQPKARHREPGAKQKDPSLWPGWGRCLPQAPLTCGERGAPPPLCRAVTPAFPGFVQEGAAPPPGDSPEPAAAHTGRPASDLRAGGRAGTTASISQRHRGHLAVSPKTRRAQQLQRCVWPQGTRQVLAAWWRQTAHSCPAGAGEGDKVAGRRSGRWGQGGRPAMLQPQRTRQSHWERFPGEEILTTGPSEKNG